MDKGIRPACNAKFMELLPDRVNTRVGNTAFRKNVMCFIMEEFGITLASAATHYNHAFKTVKFATPELVAGLGRPEDKKGGRKPNAKVEAIVPAPVLLIGYTAPAAVVECDPNDAGETGEPQTVFTVKKKSTGTVVAEGLSFEDATALVNKAVTAKKAKLYWV